MTILTKITGDQEQRGRKSLVGFPDWLNTSAAGSKKGENLRGDRTFTFTEKKSRKRRGSRTDGKRIKLKSNEQ